MRPTVDGGSKLFSPEQVSRIKKIIEKEIEKEVEPAPEWEVELLYKDDSRIVDLRRPLEEQRDYIIAQKGLIEHLENNDTPAKDIALYLEAFRASEVDQNGNKIESINLPSLEEKGRMNGSTENYIEAFKLISDLNREIIRDRLPDAPDEYQTDFMRILSSSRHGRGRLPIAKELGRIRENQPQLFANVADLLSKALNNALSPNTYLHSIHNYTPYESELFIETSEEPRNNYSKDQYELFTISYSIYDDYKSDFDDKWIVCGVVQLTTGEIIPVESQKQAIEALAIQQYVEGRKLHILEGQD